MSSVSTSSGVLVERSATSWLAMCGDYLELTKPRISLMVLVTVAVAGFIASWGNPDLWLVSHAIVGTALVAASSSAVNQWLEKDSDKLMQRTARRPLPAGRLSSLQVLAFAAVTLVAGLGWIMATLSWPVAGWALLTWLLYVGLYTPLKTYSPWNTGVGAVAGALPVVIGWTAVGGPLGWRCGVLFALLLLWQFPHFMAIAWMHREDYARAGLKMLTVVEPTGRHAGLHAVLASLALIPVSLAPGLMFRHWGSVLYLSGALGLGCLFLASSMLFFVSLSDRSARRLLRVSLIYLPLMFALLMLTPFLGS